MNAATFSLPNKSHYRADLAGLRGLALLFVLAFHFSVPPFHGGFIGVDIFFVLSGFLICGNIRRALHRGVFSLSAFYVRRILRLAPALITALFGTVLISFLTWPLSDARDTAYSAATATLGVSNVFFFAKSGYFDSAAMHKPLLHTWSLGVEAQFYFLWPLLHTFFYRIHRHAPAAITLTVVVSGMGSAQYFARTAPNAAFYLPHSRAWEFLVGAAVSLMPVQTILDDRPRLSNALSAAAICAMTYAAAVFRPVHVFPGIRAAVPCLATVVLIVTPRSKVSKLMLSRRILGVLGLVSYSVYLVHWPLITTLSAMRGFSGLLPIKRAIALFFSLALGTLLHVTVEKPGMKPRQISSPRYFFAAFTVVLVGLAVAFALLGRHLQGHIAANQYVAYAMLESGAHSTKLYGGVPAHKVVQLARWTQSTRKTSLFASKNSYGYWLEFKGSWFGPRVLIMGDSHAVHLRSVGVLLNRRYGANVKFWIGDSCPPLFHVRKIFRYEKGTEERCRQLNEKWRESFKKERFHTIVLAARWSTLVEDNSDQFLVPLNMDKKIAVAKDQSALYQQSRLLFQHALNGTVMDVVARAKNVVIFSQVVILSAHPKTCKRDRSCASVLRAAGKKRMKFVDDTVVRVAQNVPRVQAVLPSKYMCEDVEAESQYVNSSEVRCLSNMGREVFYTDDNHLNYLGSAYIARKWEKDSFGGIKW